MSSSLRVLFLHGEGAARLGGPLHAALCRAPGVTVSCSRLPAPRLGGAVGCLAAGVGAWPRGCPRRGGTLTHTCHRTVAYAAIDSAGGWAPGVAEWMDEFYGAVAVAKVSWPWQCVR
jgi:hypothetical protein